MTPEEWARQTHVDVPGPSDVARWDVIVAGNDSAAFPDSGEQAATRAREALVTWLGYPAEWLSPVRIFSASPLRMGTFPPPEAYETPNVSTLPIVPTVNAEHGAPWRVRIEWRDPKRQAGMIAWPVWSKDWLGRARWVPIAGKGTAYLQGALPPRAAKAEEQGEKPGMIDQVEHAIERAREGLDTVGKVALGTAAVGLLAFLIYEVSTNRR